MDKLAAKVNWHHATIEGSYFAAFSAIWGFGPVLLLYLGLSNGRGQALDQPEAGAGPVGADAGGIRCHDAVYRGKDGIAGLLYIDRCQFGEHGAVF